MKIAFRVDANQLSGFGHFSRCINLCRTWYQSGKLAQVCFVGNYNDFALQVLNKYKMEYSKVNCEDFSLLYNDKLLNFDVVVFDSYYIKQDSLDAIANSSYKSILIDDECLYDYNGIDIAVNFRFDAEKLYQYNASHQLLGIQYFVVKPELVQLRKNNLTKQAKGLNKLLMFSGGAFSDNEFMEEIISCVNEYLPKAEVTLIAKEPFNKKRAIYKLMKPAFDIENTLMQTDAVINGGGIIKYESSYSLIPTASFSTTLLQFEDSKILSRHGVHFDLGLLEELSKKRILKQLSNFLLDDNLRTNLINTSKEVYSTDPTQYLVNRLNDLL